MQIQRAQSLEQLIDKKKKSQPQEKKNKKNKLKIEKLRDSNFELKKTQNEPVIEMQKAQSFEQPSDNFLKSKMQNKNMKLVN